MPAKCERLRGTLTQCLARKDIKRWSAAFTAILMILRWIQELYILKPGSREQNIAAEKQKPFAAVDGNSSKVLSWSRG